MCVCVSVIVYICHSVVMSLMLDLRDSLMKVSIRGVATGGGISVYIPSKISLPYKFLCGYWLFCSHVGHEHVLILKLE